jgi:signal transduction histidine kinase
MSYFAISNLIIVAINLPSAIFFFASSKGRQANIALGYLCLIAVVWGFASFQYSIAPSRIDAVFWWKIASVASILSTVIFHYFILSFLKIKMRVLNLIVCMMAAVWLYLNFFVEELFIGELKFIFNELYYISWPRDRISVYLVYYVSFYFILLFHSFYLLLKDFIKSPEARRQQMKFLLLGMGGGFVGCHACFLPVFGFNIYPYLNILIAFYTLPIGYAIVKYRFLDTSLAFTRGGVFLFIYTLVLGIPIWVGFKLLGVGQWLIPVSIMAVCATVGPFVYLYAQKRTEDALLQEQRAYQTTLRKASMGMGQVKDLGRLLNLIIHIVTRAVRISHCSIYLFHRDSKQYVLKASKGTNISENLNVIPGDSSLVEDLYKNKNPIVCAELKQKVIDFEDPQSKNIENLVDSLNAALIIPSFIDERLIAIFVLGEKRSGKLFSHDDLIVFSILANQSALAIENAQFCEDMKKTHEQLFKAEKMATIGTMADGLSHQINNRLHAMGFIAGDALDTIKHSDKVEMPAVIKTVLEELRNALERIEDNVKRGGEIVEGLLKYTRKGEEGFSAVDLSTLIDASLEMAQFKIKVNEMLLVRGFSSLTPKIKGNFTQLQEVFFNIIDNAYDAMMQRKNELKEPGYQATLEISAKPVDNRLEITIHDNGMGVRKEDAHKLFTPFFTTKLSSKKGTGLGLYVIRQIIEENHQGRVSFISEYQNGSVCKILLPMASENKATNLN